MNIVKEHINFTRGLDPKTAMNIGLANKRNFDNDKEVAEWLFLFPEVCTEGSIKNWKEAIEKDWRTPATTEAKFDVSLKLQIVKWIKMNIHFDTEYMGLKEAKTIFDLLEAIVEQKYINESLHFERGLDPKGALGIGIFNKLKPLNKLYCKKPIAVQFGTNTKAEFIIHIGYWCVIKKIKMLKNQEISLELATYDKNPKVNLADLPFIGGEYLIITPEQFFEHFEILNK